MSDSVQTVECVLYASCPAGRNTETIQLTLARAVKLQTERRVFLDENTAIAFR